MGEPLPIDPGEALLRCIEIAAGEVRYASDRIAELTPDQAVGPVIHSRPLSLGKDGEDPQVRVEEHGAPALHVWIVVRREAMDRLVSYSKIAIAAGIAERQVRLAERQGELIAEAIRGILTDLGVADRPEAPSVVRKHLSLVAGGTA